MHMDTLNDTNSVFYNETALRIILLPAILFCIYVVAQLWKQRDKFNNSDRD